jgi:hypothetical protein
MRRLAVALVLVVCSAAPAAAETWLIPPVDAVVARRFEPPGTSWGPGHRGIDYAAPPGTLVRAASSGVVRFAGRVANVLAVTIAHVGGLETTYSDLDEIYVHGGDVVEQGYWIGVAGRAHDGVTGIHFGLKRDGTYIDPESALGAIDISEAINLAPLVWEPPALLLASFREPFLTAEAPRECEPQQPLSDGPPNDNVAVLVAGIGSKTAGGTSAALYEDGGAMLGYDGERAYRFSYKGSDDASLHEPYERTETFGDIRAAAGRLRLLLERVARRHPGAQVDLIAHSQGGIVARSYLELSATAWDERLPLVDHLVTFSSPHGGAPLAAGGPVLDDSQVGHRLLDAASWWAHHGGPLPDPRAVSVEQLAPGSGLLERLDREAASFGTRVLSLAIPNDLVVPAHAAFWAPYESSVAPPRGLNGHDAVVSSPDAVARAQAFLRDAPPTCRGAWDLWGPRVGRVIGLAERALPWVIGR